MEEKDEEAKVTPRCDHFKNCIVILIVNFVFCSFLILFFLSFSSLILHFHICTVGIHN